MSARNVEVGKVGNRLGRLECASTLRVPNLPNVPHLFSRIRTHAHARVRACVCVFIFRLGRLGRLGAANNGGVLEVPNLFPTFLTSDFLRGVTMRQADLYDQIGSEEQLDMLRDSYRLVALDLLADGWTDEQVAEFGESIRAALSSGDVEQYVSAADLLTGLAAPIRERIALADGINARVRAEIAARRKDNAMAMRLAA